jgi:allantoin racemase
MRIWYQSAVEEGKAANYRRALENHFKRVADRGTEVRFHGVPANTWKGLHAAEAAGYPYLLRTRGYQAFLHNALRAEHERYDAFVIGAFTEPALREIRASIDIPVVSGLEAVLLNACTVAKRMALLVPKEEVAYSVRLSVQEHGLAERVAGVYITSPELSDAELDAAFIDAGPVVERFEATARRALSDYVDAIIPAEGILGEIVATHGPRQIEGAAVLDSIGIPVLQAELMGRLWQRTGLRAGRRWHYRRPPINLIDPPAD